MASIATYMTDDKVTITLCRSCVRDLYRDQLTKLCDADPGLCEHCGATTIEEPVLYVHLMDPRTRTGITCDQDIPLDTRQVTSVASWVTCPGCLGRMP